MLQTDYYEIKTEAAEPLIALADAKEWLRVDTDVTADDVLIQALVDSATQVCEIHTNRCFIQREFYGYFAGLALSNQPLPNYDYPFLQVRRAPLKSLTDVTLYVDGSYSAVVDPSEYELQVLPSFSRIRFGQDLEADESPEADVPEVLVTAVKQQLSFLYENRGDVAPDGNVGMPLEVRSILTKYRILNTF
jgi:uncharacterized phiE125 gp8 family phage protein